VEQTFRLVLSVFPVAFPRSSQALAQSVLATSVGLPSTSTFTTPSSVVAVAVAVALTTTLAVVAVVAAVAAFCLEVLLSHIQANPMPLL
jgi:hypothetical protein